MRQRAALLAVSIVCTVAGLLIPVAAVAGGRAGRSSSSSSSSPSSSSSSSASVAADSGQTRSGYAVPDKRWLHIRVSFLAGYGVDEAQNSRLGFEAQGSVGWATVELFGSITDHLSYRLDVNPVNDSAPLPSCGEANYFYPNSAQAIGPVVRCTSGGLRRVDNYKFTALDPLNQQGPIRQAYVEYQRGGAGFRFGRFILPIGFNWLNAGSFTAKDATHIQRIDAQAAFAAEVSWAHHRANGAPLFKADLVAFVEGDNRFNDYNYYYFVAPSTGTNSGLGGLFSATLLPTPAFELRVAYKHAYTGSKVESIPNYFADKHNDMALILSARYRFTPHLNVFGEYAHYVWGPTATSAALVGVDTAPINKNGYYVGAQGSYPLTHDVTLGMTVTREELSRNDSLVKYMAAHDLYNVTMGKKERDTIVRVSATLDRYLTLAVYRNWLNNPFPWLSGIAPVSGPGQYQSRGSNKWGVVVLMRFPS